MKQIAGSFDDFVPSGQKNVMLLDDNLLSFNGGESTSVAIIPARFLISWRAAMLKSFGHDAVSVVCIYGFDTRLSGDCARWMMLRRLQLIHLRNPTCLTRDLYRSFK